MGKLKNLLIDSDDTDVLDYNLMYGMELLEDTLPYLTKRMAENPDPKLVELVNRINEYVMEN
jgi:hypothetical protein